MVVVRIFLRVLNASTNFFGHLDGGILGNHLPKVDSFLKILKQKKSVGLMEVYAFSKKHKKKTYNHLMILYCRDPYMRI